MMLLCDVGNTRLKWARTENGDLAAHGAVSHCDAAVHVSLDQHWLDSPKPARIAACSVAARECNRALEQWVAEHWSLEVQWLDAIDDGWGVRCAYSNPSTMGADRWATLVAARELSPQGACVVSCGTAITVDLLDSTGRHLGGIIMPGVALMRRSLADGTALIDRTEGHVVQLADNTPDAVATGTALAGVATIERLFAEARGLVGASIRCIMTGGDAELIGSLVSHEVRIEPHLVLRGVGIMAGGEQ